MTAPRPSPGFPASMTAAELRRYQSTGRLPGELDLGDTPAKASKRARRRDEEATQRAIVQWLDLALRPGARFFHPANGGARSKVEAAMFQQIGVRAGVPDLVLAWSEAAPYGTPRLPSGERRQVSRVGFLEVKTGRGSLTEAQREFRAWCLDNCIPYAIVRSLTEAVDVVTGWGLTKNGGIDR